MDKIRISLVDDHKLFREGVKLMLNTQENIEIVEEFESGERILEKEFNDHIDILITDINMEGVDGFEVVNFVKQNFKNIRIIVLSMIDSEYVIRKMVGLGASSYLMKNIKSDELIDSIFKVYLNGFSYPNQVIEIMKKELVVNKEVTPDSKINSVEEEILNLVIKGNTNQEIAVITKMSKRTVESYRNNLIKKLNVKNSAEMVAKVIKLRIVKI